MKKTLKLIPALAMLLVSAILVSTSTYAWFSMNNQVTVTGMTIKTQISDNLLIAPDTIDSVAKASENTFKNGLNQSVAALLEPVSTIDGKAFWYTSTTNVQADGDAIADAYVAYAEDTNLANSSAIKSKYDDDFQTNYGITGTVTTANVAYGYVDYVFQLKAINTDSSNTLPLKMTKVNLTYNKATAVDPQIKAYRVAIFAEKFGDNDSNDATPDAFTADAGTLKTVLRENGAVYFSGASNNYAISANAAPSTAVNLLDTAATLANVTAGSTEYFKVVVRLWLEGEDQTCNNATYLQLTKDWSLDLAAELGGTTEAATHITSAAGAVATAGTGTDTKKATVTLDANGKLSNGETPASYVWKNASDDSAISNATSSSYTNDGAAKSVYCVITTTRGSVYTTNTVELTAGS